MNKRAAALFAAVAMATAPVAIAPMAHADICAGAHGRHFGVGGCTPGLAGDAIAGAVAVAGADDWAAQTAAGQPPCYTVEGVPYYTPDGDPC